GPRWSPRETRSTPRSSPPSIPTGCRPGPAPRRGAPSRRSPSTSASGPCGTRGERTYRCRWISTASGDASRAWSSRRENGRSCAGTATRTGSTATGTHVRWRRERSSSSPIGGPGLEGTRFAERLLLELLVGALLLRTLAVAGRLGLEVGVALGLLAF